MSKYICPLCGATYYNVNDLANCTSKDAKAINEKENKIKEETKRKEKLRADLLVKKKEIESLTLQLQAKINSYNTIGRELASIDPKAAAHCTFSISYSEKDSTFDKRDIIKEACKINPSEWDKSFETLSDLIDKTFNF